MATVSRQNSNMKKFSLIRSFSDDEQKIIIEEAQLIDDRNKRRLKKLGGDPTFYPRAEKYSFSLQPPPAGYSSTDYTDFMQMHRLWRKHLSYYRTNYHKERMYATI